MTQVRDVVKRYNASEFSAQLARLLKDRDMTAGALGRLVFGKPSNTPYNWVNGRNMPLERYMPAIADALGVPVEALTGRTKAQEPAPPQRLALPAPAESDGAIPFSLLVGSNGRARVQINVEMPLAVALALVKTLVDSKVIDGGSDD